jgi:hypothetical protein
MGILMIIFGSLALLGALIGISTGGGLMTPGSEMTRRFQEETMSFGRITNLMSLPVAVLQLVAGIWAVRYKRGAPMLATTYAVLSILIQIISLVLLWTYLLPAMEKVLPPGMAEKMRSMMIVGIVFGAVIGMVWQILVLILMNRPSARAACVN